MIRPDLTILAYWSKSAPDDGGSAENEEKRRTKRTAESDGARRRASVENMPREGGRTAKCSLCKFGAAQCSCGFQMEE